MKLERKFRKDLNDWRWGFDVTIMGQRIRRYEFATMRDAKEALGALHSHARAIRYGLVMPAPKITLQDLFDKLGKDKALEKRKEMLAIFEGFLEAVDPLTPLNKLARADWKAFLAQLEERDLKASTINRYLADVSSALRMASEYFQALSEWNPPRVPWKPKPLGRDRLLSVEEISRLLSALRSERQYQERDRGVKQRREVYDLFRLMLLTGAREGELLNLTQN